MNDRSEAGCSLCRYFKPVDAANGNCHRYPPVFAGDSSPRDIHHWRYPLVSIHGWCGEYAAQISSIGVSS